MGSRATVRPTSGADRWFQFKSEVHQKLVATLTPDQLKAINKDGVKNQIGNIIERLIVDEGIPMTMVEREKLTEEILAWAEEQLAADPALRPAQLPDRIQDAFGVRAHPRSAERALARRRERHSKSRGTARPRDAEGG